jgi:hypothetical protein
VEQRAMNPRFGRRTLLVLPVAALAATAARLAAPTQAHPRKPSRALICGSERGRVKTLQDRPKLYSAKPKTVGWLMGLTRPKPAPKDRSNFERHINARRANEMANFPARRPVQFGPSHWSPALPIRRCPAKRCGTCVS